MFKEEKKNQNETFKLNESEWMKRQTQSDLDFFNFWIKPESDYSVKIVKKFRIKKERFLKENGAIESNNDHCFLFQW